MICELLFKIQQKKHMWFLELKKKNTFYVLDIPMESAVA